MRHSRTAFALYLSAILFTAFLPSARATPPQNLVLTLSSHTQLSETLNGVAINDYVWSAGGGGFYPSSAIGGITVPGSNFLLADPLIPGGYLEIQTYAYGAFELDNYAAALEAEGGNAAVIPVPPPTTIDYSQSGATVLTSNGEVAVNITVIGPPILQITNDPTMGASVFWPVVWASYSLLWSPDLLSPLPWQPYPAVPSLSGDGNYLIVNVAALELTNPIAFFRLVSNPVVVPAAPVVVTTTAYPVAFTTAGLTGTIQPNGLDTTYWFQWGGTAGYGQTTSSNLVYGSNTAPVSVGVGINGLAAGTTYHFQLYGSNSDGISSGGDVTFTTPIPPPAAIVATFAPSNITSTSALLQGTVNGEGSTWLGFYEWGTTTSYGNTTANFYYPGTSGPGATYPETAALSGLAPNTTYHYRIDAYNGNPNEALGNDVTFSTSGSVAQAPPTVTTLAASGITSSSAQINGSVNPNGADTMYYYNYGLTSGYGSSTPPFGIGSGTSVQNAPATLGAAPPNTTYHYQIVAYNSGGTSYGADASFTTGTAPTAPTVQTLAAIGTTSSNAFINGSLNPNGAPTTAYFQWGTDTSYGSNTTPFNFGLTPASDYQVDLTNLSASTTYHCRFVGSNSAGTSYGADVTFTTGGAQAPPQVLTLAASAVTENNAVLNGLVNPNGDASTSAFFEWGTTTSYGNLTTETGIGPTLESDFQAAITNLSPSTTYHYRIDAANTGGASYGADATFTTAWVPVPPTLIAPGATTAGLVTLSTLTPTFSWNASSQAAGSDLVITKYPYGSGSIVAEFGVVTLSSYALPSGYLLPGTAYSWHMFSFNNLGDHSADSPSYYFVTPSAPTVTTMAATSIFDNGATLNGSVNPNGASTTVYFQFGTTTSYGNTTTPAGVGFGTGAVNASASTGGINSGTTYHFRAVGYNSLGTNYGPDMSFMTTIE